MPGQRYIVKAPLRASEQASQAEESCGELTEHWGYCPEAFLRGIKPFRDQIASITPRNMTYSLQKQCLATPQLKKKFVLLILRVCVCVASLYACASWDWSYRWLWAAMWALGIQPWSSATNALKSLSQLSSPCISTFHLSAKIAPWAPFSGFMVEGFGFVCFFLTNDNSTHREFTMRRHCSKYTPGLISIKAYKTNRIIIPRRVKTN